MPEEHTALAEQFEDMPQQKSAATLGMWTFLATEILFFGGMFMTYITYRHLYPHAFAEASRHTIVLFGTINTANSLNQQPHDGLRCSRRAGKPQQISGALPPSHHFSRLLFSRRQRVRVLRRPERAPLARSALQQITVCAGPNLLVSLLGHDRSPRNPCHRWCCLALDHRTHGRTTKIFRVLPYPSRNLRPLLAFRRYRLDLLYPLLYLINRYS